MAIGARITSENLSGKTATVTFIPYTGSTSGTTVNLGENVIPFNNITTHPYGVYNIYVPEYDYTYTLNIPEPEVDVQTYVYMNRMNDSDNYAAATLNFNTFTAEIIDLGVDINIWNNNNIYEITNSGYMYYFRGVADSNDRLVVFTDASNNEITRYSGTTGNASRNTLDGGWTTFEDVDNGVLKYSDGTSVYTYTWDPVTHYIDIEWDWDAISSDNTFIIKKWEVAPLSGWTNNGPGQSYIVNPNDGTTSLFKTWTDGTYIRHHISPSSNAIHVITETQDNVTGSTYTTFEIYDTSGNILETVLLTGATYNNYYEEFHGTNKHTIVFYSYNDINVPYKIIHYNSDTSTLIQTSHNRGTEYQNINMQGYQNFWSNSVDRNNGAVVIQLYSGGNWTSYGYEVTFCDIMYMFDNQSTFSTYTFADDESKKINSWGQLSDIYRVACDNGDGIAAVLTIMSGSTRIESLSVNVTDVYQYNYWSLGNKSIYQIFTNSANNVTYKYINELGVVTDTLDDYGLITSYASNVNTQGQNGYISIQSEGNIGFYVYSGSTGFTQTDYYGNIYDTPPYDTNTFKQNSDMVLFTDGQLDFRVLNSTGLTQSFSFPEYSGYSINVGATKFMFVYSDYNDNNLVKIRLYDFAGTLLNSETTTWTNSWNTYGVNERFVVNNYTSNTVEIYLVSENVITSVTTQDYGSEEEVNDYIYNND